MKSSNEIENSVVFPPNLMEEEFISNLKNIIGEINYEDYFTLGSDLTEFIAIKSSLFKLENIKLDKKNVAKFLQPGENLDLNLLRIITTDTDLLPMVCKPAD